MVGPPAKQESVQRSAASEEYAELDAPASAVDSSGQIASDYDKRYESIYKELWEDFNAPAGSVES